MISYRDPEKGWVEGENRRGGGEGNESPVRKDIWERGERWEKRAVLSPACLKKAFILLSMGNAEGKKGLFLLSSQ